MCKVTLIFVVLVHAVCGLPRSSQEAEADHSVDEGNFATHPRTSRDILLQKDVFKELPDFIVNDDLASEIIHYDSDANKRLERSNDGLERLKRSSESVLVQDEKPDSTEYLECQRCMRRGRMRRWTASGPKKNPCKQCDDQVKRLQSQLNACNKNIKNVEARYKERIKQMEIEHAKYKRNMTAALGNMAKTLAEARAKIKKVELEKNNLSQENAKLQKSLNESKKWEAGLRTKAEELRECTVKLKNCTAKIEKSTTDSVPSRKLDEAREEGRQQGLMEGNRACAQKMIAKDAEIVSLKMSLTKANKDLETCHKTEQAKGQGAKKCQTELTNCQKIEKQHAAAINSKLIELNKIQQLLTQVQRNFSRQQNEYSVMKKKLQKWNVTVDEAEIRGSYMGTEQNLSRIQSNISKLKKQLQKKNVTTIILEIGEFSETREWLTQVQRNLSWQQNVTASYSQVAEFHELRTSLLQVEKKLSQQRTELSKLKEQIQKNNVGAIDAKLQEWNKTQESLTQVERNLIRQQKELFKLDHQIQKYVSPIVLNLIQTSKTRERITQLQQFLTWQQTELFGLKVQIRTNVTGIDSKFMASNKTQEFVTTQPQTNSYNATMESELFKFMEQLHQKGSDAATDVKVTDYSSKTQESTTQPQQVVRELSKNNTGTILDIDRRFGGI